MGAQGSSARVQEEHRVDVTDHKRVVVLFFKRNTGVAVIDFKRAQGGSGHLQDGHKVVLLGLKRSTGW